MSPELTPFRPPTVSALSPECLLRRKSTAGWGELRETHRVRRGIDGFRFPDESSPARPQITLAAGSLAKKATSNDACGLRSSRAVSMSVDTQAAAARLM